jgi:hypothetical protein
MSSIVIENNEKWEWRGHIASSGYRTRENIPIGRRSIRITLGYFHHRIFAAAVVCYWGFDEDDYLLDVLVERHIR